MKKATQALDEAVEEAVEEALNDDRVMGADECLGAVMAFEPGESEPEPETPEWPGLPDGLSIRTQGWQRTWTDSAAVGIFGRQWRDEAYGKVQAIGAT